MAKEQLLNTRRWWVHRWWVIEEPGVTFFVMACHPTSEIVSNIVWEVQIDHTKTTSNYLMSVQAQRIGQMFKAFARRQPVWPLYALMYGEP